MATKRGADLVICFADQMLNSNITIIAHEPFPLEMTETNFNLHLELSKQSHSYEVWFALSNPIGWNGLIHGRWGRAFLLGEVMEAYLQESNVTYRFDIKWYINLLIFLQS